MAELPPNLMATLREMSSYQTAYWFRRASCKKLVELGFAEETRPTLIKSPHQITEAGRKYLRDHQ